MKKSLLLLLTSLMLVLSVSSCRTSSMGGRSKVASTEKQEFRGAWIQTAWQEHYRNKTPEQCKQYMRQLVQTLHQTGFNAILFQVRPEGDAFYKSQLEPWSRFLTGAQGRKPAQDWDPMAYMIELCHSRGMEFHAWINPYRMFSSKAFALAPDHLYYKHPEWFVIYDERLYLNPGLPESRSWIRDVVKDIVSRYDIDAIHMDDYFYPYPANGLDFDDRNAFNSYGSAWGYNTTSRKDLGDFRRRCVNILIKSVNEDIKAIKPWVRFGISPFGIYRNQKSWAQGSATNGTQCYDDLYADVLTWAQQGWIDYVIPQIYWEIGHTAADYTTLCNWWAKAIPSSCHLYIGQSIERSLDGKAANNPSLLTSSNHFTKKLRQAKSSKNVRGNCFWYAYQVEDNQFHVRDFLKQSVFVNPAMVPAYTELNDKAPGKVRSVDAELVRTQSGLGIHLMWRDPATDSDVNRRVKYYNVYRFKKGQAVRTNTLKHLYRQVEVPEFYDYDVKNGSKYTYVITAVDHYNNEGKPVKETLKVKL